MLHREEQREHVSVRYRRMCHNYLLWLSGHVDCIHFSQAYMYILLCFKELRKDNALAICRSLRSYIFFLMLFWCYGVTRWVRLSWKHQEGNVGYVSTTWGKFPVFVQYANEQRHFLVLTSEALDWAHRLAIPL